MCTGKEKERERNRKRKEKKKTNLNVMSAVMLENNEGNPFTFFL